MIRRYHAVVSGRHGRLFDVWLSARSEDALRAALMDVIAYLPEAV